LGTPLYQLQMVAHEFWITRGPNHPTPQLPNLVLTTLSELPVSSAEPFFRTNKLGTYRRVGRCRLQVRLRQPTARLGSNAVV